MPAPDDHPAPDHDAPRLPGAYLRASTIRLSRLIGENKTLSLVVYAGLVFVKVLAVSHWRLSTALGVLSISSLPLVVAGASLSALPSLALFLLGGLLYLATSGYWRQRWSTPASASLAVGPRARSVVRRNRVLLAATAVVVVVAIALPPWTLTVSTVVCALVVGFLVRGVTARRADRPGAAGKTSVLAGLAAVMVVITVLTHNQFVSAVWVPHETLSDVHGRTLTVGYVLDDDGGNTSVLVTRTRLLKIVPDARIATRTVCVDGDPYSFHGRFAVPADSLLLLVLRAPSPPACAATKP